jgi:hypothetical protein
VSGAITLKVVVLYSRTAGCPSNHRGLDSLRASGVRSNLSKENHVVTAYVLLQTEVGWVERTLNALTAAPAVAWADPIAGPYDVIAAFEDSPPEVFARLELPGVTRTITCPTGGT